MSLGSESAAQADRRLAAAVQQALMANELPECTCGRIVLNRRTVGPVGGDFSFFHELGQDQVAFAIGDVMGHGLGSGVLMTLILGMLHGNQGNQRRPCPMVHEINQMLLNLGRKIDFPVTCSMIYGVVDLPTGTLLYVNAGHPNPVVLSREQQTTYHLPTNALLLGIEDRPLIEGCHQFHSYDRLVLFTDGLTEAHNGDGVYFSEAKMRELISSSNGQSADALAEQLFEQVDRFCHQAKPQDDQTIVIIDFDEVSTQF